MGRPMLIVGLVGLLMVTGVAVASPAHDIRHPASAPLEGRGHSIVVERGDHLWSISERHLEKGTPVAPYWRQVVELNTPTLRSGDPDLIFPGEVIELPPVSGRP